AADDADDERASLARAASDPGESLIRLGLGSSHQGRFEEAAQRFERAVALGAARARAAARDADALNAEATFLHSRGSPASPTFDETSRRKRKIDRRTRLVASADAARRWRDASALTSAALGRFQGQVANFAGHRDGQACYRCFVGDAFDAEDCDTCADLGVLGAMVGMVGAFGAMAAMRVLLEGVSTLGDPQWGQLHVLDGLKPSLRTMRIARDPECNGCGLTF
ncbi:MAG: hypothetical protein VW935_01360, partial [Novosphingobium sp.]